MTMQTHEQGKFRLSKVSIMTSGENPLYKVNATLK